MTIIGQMKKVASDLIMAELRKRGTQESDWPQGDCYRVVKGCKQIAQVTGRPAREIAELLIGAGFFNESASKYILYLISDSENQVVISRVIDRGDVSEWEMFGSP